MDIFELDAYPGKPKILFIGIGHSTHTHAWIDLLEGSEFNVRLFAMPYELVPPVPPIKTYLSVPSADNPNNLHKYMDYPHLRLDGDNIIAARPGYGRKFYDPYEWLAAIVEDWRPDIIHTLGLFDEQGGLFYYEARKRFNLHGIGKWVLQLRGGSDIALRKYNPETAGQILEILSECDEVITDNYVNIDYIKELGLGNKVASVAPVPGTGGLDTDVEIEDVVLPSRKERLILWPKAYESPWSKALPVMEALVLAWEEIKPCRVYMTASTPETETWFRTLPQEIQENCILLRRIPRNELMQLMKVARVLLAPSLVDGVPNSLYEAMTTATFPIVSPLNTIKPVVENEVNTLFAHNLYPEDISQALVRAMSDDVLVDNAAKKNLDLVKKLASRRMISSRMIEYYERIASQYRKENLAKFANRPLVSVITPTYNRADYLSETIESVLNQDYTNIEYIVLDDGSKDNTIEVLKKYSDRIYWEAQENMGETRTVNKAMKMARGSIICIVNSDDPLIDGAISKAVSFMEQNPDVIVAYPNWIKINSKSEVMEYVDLPEYDYRYMVRQHHCIVGPGAFIKKSLIDQMGGRDPAFRYVADFEFWLRGGLYGRFARIPEYLATFRVHPDSASQAHTGKMMAGEHIKLINKYFSFPNIPNEVLEIKREAYSWAHFVAAQFSGPNKWLVYWHVLCWFLYHPTRNKLGLVKRKILRLFTGVGFSGR